MKKAVKPSFEAVQGEIAALPVQIEGETRRVEFEWAPEWEAFKPGNDAKACNGDLTSRERPPTTRRRVEHVAHGKPPAGAPSQLSTLAEASSQGVVGASEEASAEPSSTRCCSTKACRRTTSATTGRRTS